MSQAPELFTTAHIVALSAHQGSTWPAWKTASCGWPPLRGDRFQLN
jgi:hypothetical protein